MKHLTLDPIIGATGIRHEVWRTRLGISHKVWLSYREEPMTIRIKHLLIMADILHTTPKKLLSDIVELVN